MSYYINVIGQVAAVKRQLDQDLDMLQGQSKEELREVLPALNLLLDQHVHEQVVHLKANGHATFDSGTARGKKIAGQVEVELKVLGRLAE